MSAEKKAKILQKNRKNRVRTKLTKSNRNNRKRVYLHISNKHMQAQLIDDVAGKTLVTVSTKDKGIKQENKALANKEYSEKLASAFIDKITEKQIDKSQGFVFDRGQRLFHGRVKVFADKLREAGMNF